MRLTLEQLRWVLRACRTSAKKDRKQCDKLGTALIPGSRLADRIGVGRDALAIIERATEAAEARAGERQP